MDHEPDVRGVTPVDRLREDELLGPVVERIGPRHLEPAEAFFPRFVTSVLRQQVSMDAATAIEDRLRATVEVTPEAVLATDESTLRAAGLSAQKAATVQSVAARFESGEWSRVRFEDAANERVIEELTSVHGVGVWTAKMQLLFALGRPDVFPVEDLGIRRGMTVLTGEDLSRAEMRELATRWAPVRSLASLYLWELTD